MVGPLVWVVDELQPVAALVDAATASPRGRVGWADLPPGSSPRERRVLGAPEGLWVQQPGGPLVLVGVDGWRSGHSVSDGVLGAVTSHGAWCAPSPRGQDLAATSDAPPQHHRTLDQLHLAQAGAVTRTVNVDAAVVSIRAVDDDLFVEVETGQWRRQSLGSPTHWELEMDTAWLRLGSDQAVPRRLSPVRHASAAPPIAARRVGWRGRLPEFVDPDAPGVGRPSVGPFPVPHERAGGLDWYVGSGRGPRAGRGEVYAVGVEPTGARRERWRIPLGPGAAVATAATDHHLWVAVQEPRHLATYSRPTPVALVRVDVRSGRPELVLGPDAIDITDLSWPLGQPPVDAADYAEVWRRRFEGLDTYWTSPDGRIGPLSAGLTDPQVDTVGTWPDTALHVTFAWASRPGMRLRRIVPLYDDLGRAEEPEYADIHIMEDLDTGRVPDRPRPGADYLDM